MNIIINIPIDHCLAKRRSYTFSFEFFMDFVGINTKKLLKALVVLKFNKI